MKKFLLVPILLILLTVCYTQTSNQNETQRININMAPSGNTTGSVYWVGTDGNVYLKAPDSSGTWSTQNLGSFNGTGANLATLGATYDFSRDSGPGVSRITSATRIADPSAGGQTLGDSTTASGPDNTSSINNIQAALNRLGIQETSGGTGIDNSYNYALQQLLLGKNQGEQSYNQNKQAGATDYVSAKNTIGSQAGSTLNSLLRLLGSRGAGGSATDVARQAVARGATLQRQGVGNTYAQNQQGLDQKWGDFLTNYNNQVSGAGSQRDEQKRTLSNTIGQSRADLLQQLSTLYSGSGNASGAQSSLDSANSLLDTLAKSAPAPINYSTQAYQAPALSAYNTTPASSSVGTQNSGNDYFSPYLSTLLGKKQSGAFA